MFSITNDKDVHGSKINMKTESTVHKKIQSFRAANSKKYKIRRDGCTFPIDGVHYFFNFFGMYLRQHKVLKHI